MTARLTYIWQHHRPATLLIGGALLLRLAFALLPINWLFMLLEDDAWMVTAIARNWAWGLGITADGVNPTNGFHPLYPLTLGAVPYLFPLEGLHTGFRINLLICAMLNTAVLVPFYALARHLSNPMLAVAGLALMALNPYLIQVSVNAMETSLALLLLLTLWWWVLCHPPQTLRAAVLPGLLAGAAMLARLDSGLAAALLGVWLVLGALGQRRLPWAAVGYGAAATLVMLPYFAYNYGVFGTLSPSSGRALAYMHSYAESFTFTSGLQLVAYQPIFDMTWASPVVLAVGTLLLLAAYATLPPRPRWFLAAPTLYICVLTFYYAYVQQQGRPRYYVAAAFVLLLIVLAWLAPHMARAAVQQQRRVVPPVVAAVVALLVAANSALFVGNSYATATAPYQAQPAMFEAARWIAGNLPPDARIAAQNSGIFQYYSERVVLNADGKLNHEIVPVLVQRELDRYLRERGIGYVVDLPEVGDYIEFYSSSMSDAPPHAEISTGERLLIHVRRVLHRLGVGAPVELATREPERVTRPFESLATPIHQSPLPNDPSRAVTVYQLHESFGGDL